MNDNKDINEIPDPKERKKPVEKEIVEQSEPDYERLAEEAKLRELGHHDNVEIEENGLSEEQWESLMRQLKARRANANEEGSKKR